MTIRRCLAALLVAGVLAACAKVENPSGPTSRSPDPNVASPTAPTAPAPAAADRIEFRVFGATLLTPITIKHIDPVNGLTITTSSPPYLATVTSTDADAFLYLEGSGFGVSTSVLQVQIFVNGKLFREGSSVGSVLFAQASGTIHH